MFDQSLRFTTTRRIWKSPDAVFLIFAASAAEFAGSKAVDWLFYTNKLPNAPIERLFDTVRFAQKLFFSSVEEATATVNNINRIHAGLEKSRSESIPDWAYRDVLFMLVDYGERAHEVVYGPLSKAEKIENFEVSMAVGKGMHIPGLPKNYEEYLKQREYQLAHDYNFSELTRQLFKNYKKALRGWRYSILRIFQGILLPAELTKTLHFRSNKILKFLLKGYRYLPGRGNKLKYLHRILLPKKHYKQLKELENFYHSKGY